MFGRHPLFSAALVVAALGNFVDVYDLVLFLVVKNQSLKDLGVLPEHVLESGAYILNCQMVGMLVGGLVWGVLGDRIGRTKVLFGSIFLYSVANILNSLVHIIDHYALLRFLAGVGLAGELGAGVTLVAELMPARLRGYGTTIIACVGLLGAVTAGLTGDILSWRMTYVVGGGLGLLLLVLRVSVAESELFKAVQEEGGSVRDIARLFLSPHRVWRLLRCVVIGIPIWFIVGILLSNAKEVSMALGVEGSPRSGMSIAICYTGLLFGDITGGLLSQYLKSRKRAVAIFLMLSSVLPILFLTRERLSLDDFYLYLLVLGFAAGYWVLVVTMAAEQFGTNVRATVTTSIPNFIRGSIVPVSAIFLWLKDSQGVIDAAINVGIGVSVLASVCFFSMDETFSRDLDFVEGV
jgi:MFS family permease